MEAVTDFIFMGSKITADEIKRHLLLERKAMTNLDSIFKQIEHIILLKFGLGRPFYKESQTEFLKGFFLKVRKVVPRACHQIPPVMPKDLD